MSKIGVISLGCSKNRVDTERMLGLLEAAGHNVVSEPAQADVLIVNTCGFIEPAKQESIDAILEMAAYKDRGSCSTLVVTGCLSERYREELKKELPEVDLFLGVREYERLPGLLSGSHVCAPAATRKLTTPPYSAYLRIGDGCNNRCAYCAIPLIRGPLHSVPMPALLDEARALVDGGVTELTLIAQDTSGYGVDLYGRPMLLPLMEELCKLDGLVWLRVLYTYPDTVTEELLRGMAENEKICRYLDIPLQHVDDEILRRMHRRGDRAHIERILDFIRLNHPDFVLRTTMMVGFPGETDAQHEDMLRFLRDYPFDRVGAFAFSPEEDTPAALMKEQVPEEIKQARLNALMLQQQGISRARNAARLNSEVTVLLESTNGSLTRGRSYAEAPEVDGSILLPSKLHHREGLYVRARLTEARDYDILGEELL
jgi:ribosomal protein S12 methylthiotransferase